MASAQHTHPTPNPSPNYPTSQTQQQRPHHPSPPINNRDTTLVRRLISAIVMSFLLISAVSIILWAILHPHVPSVRIDSLSVSNFSLSNSHVTGQYQFQLTLENPNRRIDLEFEQFELFVYHRRDLLLKGRVPPFGVGKVNQTRMEIALEIESCNHLPKRKILAQEKTEPCSVFQMKGGTEVEMGREWREERLVSFSVRMVGLADFEAGSGWLSKHRNVDVLCDNLEVGFVPDEKVGKLMGDGRECSVYFV